MIDRLVDYLEANKRVCAPILLGVILLLAGVIVWGEVAMWTVLLAIPHISFGDVLLFYLYVGSMTLLILMPFAACHEINDRESSSSGDKFAKKPETLTIRRYLKGFGNKSVTENKYDNTRQDGNQTMNRHTLV